MSRHPTSQEVEEMDQVAAEINLHRKNLEKYKQKKKLKKSDKAEIARIEKEKKQLVIKLDELTNDHTHLKLSVLQTLSANYRD